MSENPESLVERLNVLGARFGRGEVIGGTPYAVQCWHDLIEAAEALTQAQARATAAEGEMPSREEIARVMEPQAWAALRTGDTLAYKNRRTSSLRKADAILALRKPSSAQQTITQLTRELETAVNALGELITYYEGDELHDEGAFDHECEECRQLQAARDVLSSLSHQDEQG